MKSVFVDTNVFLRFILGDVATQTERARKIFNEAIMSHVKLHTSTIVIFEIYWVLKSSYDFFGNDLKQKLIQVLQLTVEFENHELLVEAINQMDKYNFDLEDSYNFIYAKTLGVNEFETFDQKLLRKFNK
ncbi:MAG TPA: PIN domain-containing protein [Patescibacteria group bacterium]|nr:MAG: PilT protein domain protein [Candidatus Beckwithbacteria bacterium GW2011_GWC2_49_11]HLE50229.1 PIN domain-containing protein [Patescibacteria group bacterium]